MKLTDYLYLKLLMLFLLFIISNNCFDKNENLPQKQDVIYNSTTMASFVETTTTETTTTTIEITTNSEYPCLMGSMVTLEEVRERFNNGQYSNLVNRVKALANGTPFDTASVPFKGDRVHNNGRIAKNNAFLFIMEYDIKYAEKTKDILLNMYDSVTISIEDWSTENVHTASGIVELCLAYDFMLHTNYLTESEKQTIDEKLIGLIESYYNWYTNDYAIILKLGAVNNHNIINCSVLGLAGLLFQDKPETTKWLDYGATALNYFLETLINENGGYGEGYYYAFYSAVHYIPFIIAYNRWNNGSPKVHKEKCSTRPDYECSEGADITVEDFLSREKLKKAFDLQVFMRFPNGIKPPVEDGSMYGWMGSIISGIYDNGLQLWDWSNMTHDFEGHLNYSCYTSLSRDFTVETIIYCDLSLPQTMPMIDPDMYMPDSGFTIMRSGWNENDIYMMLIAENGLMRGWSHEQVDDFSFQIFAYGEYLAIDSGYISWTKRDLVANDYNHNLILIDGNGPPKPNATRIPSFSPSFEAFLCNYFDETNYQHVEATGSYKGTNLTRKMMFVHKRYFVIEDTLISMTSSETHEFEWQMHVNAGGDAKGTLSMTGSSSVVDMPSGVSMELYLSNTAGTLNFAEETNVHGWYYNNEMQHSKVIAKISSDNCKYLGIIVPLNSSDTVSVTEVSVGISDAVGWIVEFPNENYRDLIFSRKDFGSQITLDLASEGFVDGISTTGDFLVLSVDKNVPSTEIFHYVDNDTSFFYP